MTSITGGAGALVVGLSLLATGPTGDSDVRVWRSGKLGATLSSEPKTVGRASVIDGDTIEIHGQRIRLWGIDAPEGGQRCFRDGKPWRCGTDAANALSSFLGARTVSCNEKDRDRYGRMVAVCTVAGQDIGTWLVREGWALDYVTYSGGAYVSQEDAAETGRNGIWQGEFEPPWEWRRR